MSITATDEELLEIIHNLHEFALERERIRFEQMELAKSVFGDVIDLIFAEDELYYSTK